MNLCTQCWHEHTGADPSNKPPNSTGAKTIWDEQHLNKTTLEPTWSPQGGWKVQCPTCNQLVDGLTCIQDPPDGTMLPVAETKSRNNHDMTAQRIQGWNHWERDELKACPDCGCPDFHEGPSGGLSQNLICAQCKMVLNLTPFGIDRVDSKTPFPEGCMITRDEQTIRPPYKPWWKRWKVRK